VLAARPRLEVQGGTTFNFVSDGIESALAQARKAADGSRLVTHVGYRTRRLSPS
jgi:hypothetical protein